MSPEKQPSKPGFFETLRKIDRLTEILKDLQRTRQAKKSVKMQDTGKIRNVKSEDASKIVF